MKDSNNGFSYTYSAKEKEEIKSIRNKYAPDTKKEDNVTRIRRLDAKVVGTAQAYSLIFGVIGTLTLGFGMSLCMTELASMLGLEGAAAMIIGVALGFVGGILASLAYPLYNFIIKRKRAKIAPEIIRLSDEVLERYN
ncbi:MAG: hypothetical protein E7673_00045 [Ruminococcaceae bacterium]|nr:hypothetical protein [Oscillospiraceae bacterium]